MKTRLKRLVQAWQDLQCWMTFHSPKLELIGWSPSLGANVWKCLWCGTLGTINQALDLQPLGKQPVQVPVHGHHHHEATRAPEPAGR